MKTRGLTRCLIAVAFFLVPYAVSVMFDRVYYFPKHADFALPGHFFSAMDKMVTSRQGGFYARFATTRLRTDDQLYQRAIDRLESGWYGNLQLSGAIVVELNRRSEECARQIQQLGPDDASRQACKLFLERNARRKARPVRD